MIDFKIRFFVDNGTHTKYAVVVYEGEYKDIDSLDVDGNHIIQNEYVRSRKLAEKEVYVLSASDDHLKQISDVVFENRSETVIEEQIYA